MAEIKTKIGLSVIALIMVAALIFTVYSYGSSEGYEDGFEDAIKDVTAFQTSRGEVLIQTNVNNKTIYKPIPISQFCKATNK